MTFAIRGLGIFVVIVLLAILSSGALAHHSSAVYNMDSDAVITLEGTVKAWRWTNPHTFLIIVVPDEDGNDVVWRLEGPAPSFLVRHGWSRNMFKPGDVLIVRAFPMRNGSVGGSFAEVELPDGTVIQGPRKPDGPRIERPEEDAI